MNQFVCCSLLPFIVMFRSATKLYAWRLARINLVKDALTYLSLSQDFFLSFFFSRFNSIYWHKIKQLLLEVPMWMTLNLLNLWNVGCDKRLWFLMHRWFKKVHKGLCCKKTSANESGWKKKEWKKLPSCSPLFFS